MRLSKCWFIAQDKILFRIHEQRSKYFLILDLGDLERTPSLLAEKPQCTVRTSAFVEYFRKHLGTPVVVRILKHRGLKCYAFELQGLRRWYLIASFGDLREVQIVDDQGVSVMRLTMRNLFTKAKTFMGPLPPTWDTADFEVVELRPADPQQHETTNAQTVSGMTTQHRRLAKSLKRRLRTFKKSAERQKSCTPSVKQIDDARFAANLLHANLVKTGGEAQHVGRLFETYKKLKRGREMGLAQIAKIDAHTQEIRVALEGIAQQGLSDLNEIAKTFGVKSDRLEKARSSLVRSPYRSFVSTRDERVILVGKSGKDNDGITRRARSHDHWFHVVGGSGSHVLVAAKPQEGQNLPQQVRRDAAILALHFSKNSLSRSGDVYWTQRSQLVKDKGSSPGQWRIRRAEVIHVVYETLDLGEILAREKK